MKHVIGIIGGMGPLATADLFEKIIKETNATCDQDHIHTIIDSYAQIPDRTKCLLTKSTEAYDYILESALRLVNAGASVLAMPCNTAHFYYKELIKRIDLPFLNMIDVTANYIVEKYPNNSKIILLATKGTCDMNIYDDVFTSKGIDIIKPQDGQQMIISELIKSVKGGYDFEYSDALNRIIDDFKNKGECVFILGCTELPLAYEKYQLDIEVIDPTLALAKALVKFVRDKEK